MIGEQIKKARRNAGLTQKQLGDALGKGISTISEWESGKRSPDIDLLPTLAEVLGVSQAWLMTGDEPVRHNYIHVVDEHGERIIDVINDDRPHTQEARIISGGIDKMSPERRKRALKLLQTVFEEFSDSDFNEEDT